MTYRSRILSTLHSIGTGVAFLAGCLALTAFTQTAIAADAFQFLPAVNYQSGGAESQFVVAADVNGDGFSDAIVGMNQNVTIFIGRGDGVFKRASTYNIPSAWKISAADVNGDHKIDLLISSGNNVAVMLGNGDGTFGTPATFDAGNDVRDLAVADVNRDGIPDVVTASYLTGTASILLGNGDGSFRAPVIYPSNSVSLWGIGVADFNGDGKPDLAVSGFPGGVMLGNGDGSFQSPIGAIYGGEVVVVDLNADGKMDVLTGTGPGQSSLAILLGNGDGTFTSVTTNDTLSTTNLAVADLNNDGKLDVIFTYPDGNFAGIMLGNGDGTLQSPTWLNTKRFNQGQVAVADVDGNGKPDVLLTDQIISQYKNLKGGWLTVFLNNSGSASSTAVATSGSPSHVKQPVTFTATVSANGTAAPDGDLVRFYKKGTLLGSAALKNGTASFTTSKLSKGSYEITATYIGDKTLANSSATVAQVVEKP
jgi:Bacterial Ig-like domain (group 3)/FG-GAP-like repeat